MKHQDLYALTKELNALASRSTDPQLTAATALLRDRLRLPTAWVALVGETSTGKTTLLNSFLGEDVLPISAKPTTGAVVQVICDASGPEYVYQAIYNEARREPLDRDRFRQQVIDPKSNVARLQLVTNRKGEQWDDLQILDTPGYNSSTVGHEETLFRIIPDCNVIVLVVGYRSGFGQVDHDLYQCVAGSLKSRSESIPILLVINRIPDNLSAQDRRLQEIISRSSDSLRQKPEVLLVKAAPPDEAGRRTLPQTDHIWQKIHQYSLSPAVIKAFRVNIKQVLSDFCGQIKNQIQTSIAAGQASLSEISSIEQNLRDLSAKCRTMINETFDKLDRQVPMIIKSELTVVHTKAAEELDKSDNWQDAEACSNYLAVHILPSQMSRVATQVNDYIMRQLDELNQRLSDLVNTCVRKFQSTASLNPDSTLGDLAASIAATITARLASSAALSAVKGLGGVGGSAAGLGNLVKMGVKWIGKLFGTTFSREVYTTIGRMFTMRTVQALSVAFTVAVEGLVLVWTAQTWKKSLLGKIDKVLKDAEQEMLKILQNEVLPALRQENLETVSALLQDQIADLEKRRTDGKISPERLSALNADLDTVNILNTKIEQVAL